MTSAAVGVSTGFVAHVVMGGNVPGLLGVLPALVASTLLGLVLLYRPSLAGALVSTVLSQYLFHQWAGLGSGVSSSPHNHHHSALALDGVASHLPMSAGHLVAALVTVIAVLGVHRVRRVMVRLGQMLGRWRIHIPAPVTVSSEPRPASMPGAWWQELSRSQLLALPPCGLRGPPSYSHI